MRDLHWGSAQNVEMVIMGDGIKSGPGWVAQKSLGQAKGAEGWLLMPPGASPLLAELRLPASGDLPGKKMVTPAGEKRVCGNLCKGLCGSGCTQAVQLNSGAGGPTPCKPMAYNLVQEAVHQAGTTQTGR